MNLEILPTRTAGAAENMAVDFLLLQRHPHADVPRFRHYEWRVPAYTFGYAQKIAFVREQLPPGERFDLCRRPTGGGIVDHREDWTYALVIPRGHPLEEQRATQSYRAIHEALAAALVVQGVGAITKAGSDDEVERVDPDAFSTNPATWGQVAPPSGGVPGVCFQRAEIHDVVHAQSGAKIAGAAQKRNKHGLLFQGSIWRPAAGGGGVTVNWKKFEEDFVAGLAASLSVSAEITPWPEFNEDEVSGLVEQYSSTEWIEYR
ncbi:MAG: lipoate--protein ligase family protein [Opitutus sp.]|nr:lipoate--protein ligase family protein [Opitutus sp.]